MPTKNPLHARRRRLAEGMTKEPTVEGTPWLRPTWTTHIRVEVRSANDHKQEQGGQAADT